MAAEATLHAIVLRRRDSGESDRRLTLLTREEGIVDVLAKGARRSGSRLSGCSEPMSASILQVARGKHTAYVTQSQPISSFPGLRTDYERLSWGLALCELVAGVLPHGHPADEEFAFLVRALHDLETHNLSRVAFAWAASQLLNVSGFSPSFGACSQTGVPVQEARPFVSPHAGGYIVADRADLFTDRFQTAAEVLYGLAALERCDQPPPRLKRTEETIRVLYQFWRAVADRPLPAFEAALSLLLETGEL